MGEGVIGSPEKLGNLKIFCVLGLKDIVEGSDWIPAENCVSIVFFNFSPIRLDLPAKEAWEASPWKAIPGAFVPFKDEFCSTQ